MIWGFTFCKARTQICSEYIKRTVSSLKAVPLSNMQYVNTGRLTINTNVCIGITFHNRTPCTQASSNRQSPWSSAWSLEIMCNIKECCNQYMYFAYYKNIHCTTQEHACSLWKTSTRHVVIILLGSGT